VVTARHLWTRLETIHAVTYFAPESRAAASDCGLRGFWMGYFGFRAAPLGAVGPEVVSDAFSNFAPRMVAKSIPDAWRYATPDVLLDARRRSAAAALRRIVPGIDDIDPAAVATLIDAAYAPGLTDAVRPMFVANLRLPSPTDVVEMLWQLCTTLREHRGDAHVAALRASDLVGCEPHVLLAAEQGVPEALLRDNRGWSAIEWETAKAGLLNRGLLTLAGPITAAGAALRSQVEAATDAAAWPAYVGVDADALLAALDPVATTVERSGEIPYPNPMGLPPLR
jgi:hypothetical protein